MSDIDRLPYVDAELNYLGATSERPRYYAYETGDPQSHMPSNRTRCRSTICVRSPPSWSLDVQGFALAEQRSAVRDFWDDDEVRRVYYPEAEASSSR